MMANALLIRINASMKLNIIRVYLIILIYHNSLIRSAILTILYGKYSKLYIYSIYYDP